MTTRPRRRTQRQIKERLRALAVERDRDALLDAEIVVDDARRDLEAAIGGLRSAVAERDTIARRLSETLGAAA